jgi:hypothetical protein
VPSEEKKKNSQIFLVIVDFRQWQRLFKHCPVNTNSSPSQPEIHLIVSCHTPAQPVSRLSSDRRSNAVATQAAGSTLSCYCTRLISKSLNVRFPFKVVKRVLLSFPVECVCLQNVQQFCRQTKSNLPKNCSLAANFVYLLQYQWSVSPPLLLNFVSSLKARITVYLNEICSGWKYQARCLTVSMNLSQSLIK